MLAIRTLSMRAACQRPLALVSRAAAAELTQCRAVSTTTAPSAKAAAKGKRRKKQWTIKVRDEGGCGCVVLVSQMHVGCVCGCCA